VAGIAVSVGLPARLLLPSGWGELFSGIGGGIGSLGGADYPYAGGDQWSRLALLLALAPLLGLATALSFWPTRRPGRWGSRLGLVVLVAAYATAVTVSPPGQPLLQGAVLFALLAAWIWLPTLDRRSAALSAVLIGAAALLAVPIAARLDGSKPWVDYRHWDWGGSPLGRTESFDWNHSYGPLDWSRDGRRVVDVKSRTPHYWATEVLDQFDGADWVGSTIGTGVDLPLRRSGHGVAPLDRKWVTSARFDIRALSSQLLVGAGTVLSVSGVNGAVRTPEGVALPSALGDGDSYSLRAYDPHPSPGQMRASEGPYPSQLSRYTTVSVPRLSRLDVPPSRPVATTLNAVTVPLRTGPGSTLSRGLDRSPYARVYRLAQRLAAGKPTTFGVVEAVQRYLRANYTYSESPPPRLFGLRAFLLRDKIGYCQQFSGAMALMLRMVGIPSRVVGGFAPGERTGRGFVVSDFDAHSWVQVYFNGIGWVIFDPTPSAAPAVARTSELVAAGRQPTGLQFRTGQSASPVPIAGRRRVPASEAGLPFAWLAVAIVLAAVLVSAAVFVRRASRRRSLSAGALVEAQTVELERAFRRSGRPLSSGTTLRALESRLRSTVGPRAADYAARLRDCRYGAEAAAPPSARERRALRSAFASGQGLKGRLRSWLLMPPGGPARVTGPRRQS
jgi:transglutaminase-like putative cysteine protease